ncbi:uncharacterized protein FSUBG_6117 [Fusarium subglutinans]|uniref:Uncharacterized protein n=1 Tax=Gibberella subglutinans TaxID=42677 RepID=A0A8H5Q132_GIBSU|nr:uncharacterized protein FSUBG_6117 [Fusarium subglutinans]KAF5606284.1 hypothetical protein FSUBG_6117 [Fusarium subglutinans]
MTSPTKPFQGDKVRRYFAQLSGQAKKDAIYKFLKRYSKRVQEFLNMIEPEPEPNLAQKLLTSVSESDRSIISDQQATTEAISPTPELTNNSSSDPPAAEHLRLAFEGLSLGSSEAAVIRKRARSQYVDDDEADGQPAAKRRKRFHGGSSHCL